MVAAVACIVLAIAVLNTTNLLTAQATARAREVSIRKVLGAGRGQLAGRFLGEAVMLCLMATLLALGLVELALPGFRDLVGTAVRPDHLPLRDLAVLILELPIAVGLAAGAWPALVLSRWQPDDIFRGRGGPVGAAWLRGALVVLQFAAAIALAVATLTVLRQVEHVRSQGLGFDTENIVVAQIQPTPPIA